MRDYIKNSSAVLSVVIGIILSFSLNIDAFRLLDYYLENPDVAKKIGEQADTSLQAFDDAREKLKKTLAEMDESAGGDARKTVKPALDELNKEVKKLSAEITDLKTKGLPIGTDYFPHCQWFGKKGEKKGNKPCVDTEDRIKISLFGWRLDYFFWILKVLITGMLIGLGGPFWYDAVRGLIRTTQIFRGRDQPREPTAGKRAGESEPAKPAEIFEKHVEIRGISGVRSRLHGSWAKGDVAAQAMRARKAADARMASRTTPT